MMAAGGIAVVNAGRTRCLRRSNRPPSPRMSYMPCTGNHRSCTAKMMTRPRPKTKVGMLAATRVVPIATRSKAAPLRIAEISPTPIPSGIAMISDPVSRIALLRRRSCRRSETSMLLENDRPRSPCSARPSQLRYWTGIGWSRPRYCRNSATVSSVASGPRSALAISPGTSCMHRKTTMDTPSRTGMAPRSRRAT